jgi:calcineurin-like phosphoesterase family protein
MDQWTFAHVADIQVGSPKSFRFQPAWNDNWVTARQQILEVDPELLLIGGDLTRDGYIPEHRYELEAMKADFETFPFPHHVIPGNMDTGNKHATVNARPGENQSGDLALNLTSAELANFESVFGPSNWSVVRKNARFTGICDMLVNSGLPQEAELWAWINGLKQQPREAHHVWIMHSALFIEDPAEPNWDPTDPAHYLDWYFSIDQPGRGRLFDAMKTCGVDLVITGHIHCRKAFDVDGIHFDLAPATCMSQFNTRWPDGDPTLGFMKYDVTDDAITGTFIPLTDVSTREPYGPGGHPKPDARDYSIAWEGEGST